MLFAGSTTRPPPKQVSNSGRRERILQNLLRRLGDALGQCGGLGNARVASSPQHRSYQSSKGLSLFTSGKSSVLRVTTIRLCVRAMAAICVSGLRARSPIDAILPGSCLLWEFQFDHVQRLSVFLPV